jgi:hypothetical protein
MRPVDHNLVHSDKWMLSQSNIPNYLILMQTIQIQLWGGG